MILIHTIVPGVIRYRLWYTVYMVAVVLIGTRGWLLSSITRVPGGYTRSDPTRSKGRVRPQYPRVLDPAGNDATGTRVPARFEDPGSIFFHNISRKLIQMSNRVVPEAIVDLYFLVRLLLLSFNSNSRNGSSSRVVLIVSVIVAVLITISGSGSSRSSSRSRTIPSLQP